MIRRFAGSLRGAWGGSEILFDGPARERFWFKFLVGAGRLWVASRRPRQGPRGLGTNPPKSMCVLGGRLCGCASRVVVGWAPWRARLVGFPTVRRDVLASRRDGGERSPPAPHCNSLSSPLPLRLQYFLVSLPCVRGASLSLFSLCVDFFCGRAVWPCGAGAWPIRASSFHTIFGPQPPGWVTLSEKDDLLCAWSTNKRSLGEGPASFLSWVAFSLPRPCALRGGRAPVPPPPTLPHTR